MSIGTAGTAAAGAGCQAAPRAMVAGLRLGDHVLEPARRYAAAAGVRVVPSYTVDEAGLAIIVEADG